MKRLPRIAGLAVAMLGAALVMPAAAQQSGQAIRVIYPFAAGGTGDALIRLVADGMQRDLGQTVVVDNRTGAAGQIGVTAVKNAAADGTTLLYTPFAAMTIYPFVYKKLDYDPFKDFKPVSQFVTFDFGLAVGPHVPAKTIKELVAWLKANPAQANYGSPGAGALPHFFGLLFGNAVGVKMNHVPYRGGTPALTDLMAGQIAMVVTTASEMIPFHRDGKLRVLATSDRQRSIGLSDVPTFTESGIDIAGTGWYAMFAPAGSSDAFIERVNKSVVATLKSPDNRGRMETFGFTVKATSPAELAATQKADAALWAPIVKESGFVAD